MGGTQARRNLPVPEMCHSLFGYAQFSGTGKFRLWLGPFVHCPLRLRPPFACARPVPSARATHPPPPVTRPPPPPPPPPPPVPPTRATPTPPPSLRAPPRPHALPLRVHAGGRRKDSVPTPVSSARATPTTPPGLRAPPHPHALPLCRRRDSA